MRTAKAIIGIVCIVVLSSGVALGDSWHIESVDTTGVVGGFTSIALDTYDNPHFSYWDVTNNDLKYAYWTGSTWSITSVDTTGMVGYYTSIALDSNDNPYISYYTYTNNDLKYAYWTGSTWYISSVDITGDVGKYNSIALDSSDNPHISYFDNTNDDLKCAHGHPLWWTESVDTEGKVGWYTSIAIDPDDNYHISYWDFTNSDLKYAFWTGSTWSITSVDTAGNVGTYTSIAIDSGDNPHISYFDSYPNYDLKYAYWTGSTWSITSVDTTGGNVDITTSIGLDSNNHPHISYFDDTNDDLKYAYWTGSTWSITSVDTAGYVGRYTSIAIDSNDNPHISYYDYTNGDLKYAWYGPDVDIILTTFSAEYNDGAVALEWSVETTPPMAGGEQIAGFNLYRRILTIEGDPAFGGVSLTPGKEETWTQINPSLITGQNPYTYNDTSVESGVAYEYKLEAVLDECAETLGTTQVTAGLPPPSFAILALYPNPASNYLTCLLALPSAGAVELTLYDLSGRLVIERRIEATEPTELEAKLDVSGLASGVYTVQASMGNVEVSPACGGVAVVVH